MVLYYILIPKTQCWICPQPVASVLPFLTMFFAEKRENFLLFFTFVFSV